LYIFQQLDNQDVPDERFAPITSTLKTPRLTSVLFKY